MISIDEAINTLSSPSDGGQEYRIKYAEAIYLSVEAPKRIKLMREWKISLAANILPGEEIR